MSRPPSYRRHKRKNRPDQAVVTLGGRSICLGRYGSREAREFYERLIATNNALAGQITDADVARIRQSVKEQGGRKIGELCIAYTKTEKHLKRTPRNQHKYQITLKALRKMYGNMAAHQFGPTELRALRQQWVDRGLTARTIGRKVAVVRKLFEWAMSHDLVDPGLVMRLKAVDHEGGKESRHVCPVSEDDITAIEPHVPRQVWALIQLQWHGGYRSGEIVGLRPIDIDMTGAIWFAKLEHHKTKHRNRTRTLYFPPVCQEIIRPFLTGRRVDAPLFSPREAIAERAAEAETHRRPDHKPDPRKEAIAWKNQYGKGTREDPRRVGDHYTPGSYRRAVERGCKKAGVDRWTPHRLRHTAATNIRKNQGLVAAQIMLGHAKADVTQVYAELTHDQALEVALKIG